MIALQVGNYSRMKKKINMLIILFCFLCRAQNNFVVYDKIIDVSSESDKIYEKNILFFNDENSLFFSYKGELDNINSFLNNEEKIKSSQIIKNQFNDKYFQVKDNSFTRDILFTIDYYQDFNWEISKDKEIELLGYKCKKATGKFRGREYTAWFTTDLPISIGPLKFRGLPGIILKISDKDNIFIFEASKIVINFPQKFSIYSKLSFQFPPERNDNISYKDYIEKQNNHIKDMKAKIDANRPKGAIVISTSNDRDFNIEKSFEWEESKKP